MLQGIKRKLRAGYLPQAFCLAFPIGKVPPILEILKILSIL